MAAWCELPSFSMFHEFNHIDGIILAEYQINRLPNPSHLRWQWQLLVWQFPASNVITFNDVSSLKRLYTTYQIISNLETQRKKLLSLKYSRLSWSENLNQHLSKTGVDLNADSMHFSLKSKKRAKNPATTTPFCRCHPRQSPRQLAPWPVFSSEFLSNSNQAIYAIAMVLWYPMVGASPTSLLCSRSSQSDFATSMTRCKSVTLVEGRKKHHQNPHQMEPLLWAPHSPARGDHQKPDKFFKKSENVNLQNFHTNMIWNDEFQIEDSSISPTSPTAASSSGFSGLARAARSLSALQTETERKTTKRKRSRKNVQKFHGDFSVEIEVQTWSFRLHLNLAWGNILDSLEQFECTSLQRKKIGGQSATQGKTIKNITTSSHGSPKDNIIYLHHFSCDITTPTLGDLRPCSRNHFTWCHPDTWQPSTHLYPSWNMWEHSKKDNP